MPNSLFDSGPNHEPWDLKTLIGNYNKGFKGVVYDPVHYNKLLSSLPQPLFGDAGKALAGSGKGKLSLPFKSVLHFDPQAYTERQTTGDCLRVHSPVVLADRTLKNIEEISIGEFVLGHSRLPRKVLSTFKKSYSGQILRIILNETDSTVECTPDHEFIILKEDNEFEYFIWKKAEELSFGDKIYSPLAEPPFYSVKFVDSYFITDDYVYCIEVDEDHSFVVSPLAVSNCVSHGSRTAADISRAVQIHIGHLAEGWIARGATEGIYGSRRHGGQGMACSQAAEFLHRSGGIILRKKYNCADLSVYNASYGTRWGTQGVPQELIELAKPHQAQTIAVVKTLEEARDALANGYGLACCSNQGFSSVRDSKGFARPQGSWSHCLAITGCDDTGSEPAFVIQNSWGCVPEDTEILTDKGWKFFKDLNKTETVATLNPNTHELEYQLPTEYFEYEVNTELYHYKNKHIDLMVTNNHNLYVASEKLLFKRGKNDLSIWKLVQADKCNKKIHMKRDAIWIGEEIQYHEMGNMVIDMDIWLEFLGYFLSEGAVSLSPAKNKRIRSNGEVYVKEYPVHQIEISQHKEYGREIIGKLMDKFPIKFRKDYRRWLSGNKELHKELLPFGDCTKKYIPDYVKNLCPRQLRIFIDAMILGDGHISKIGESMKYFTSSKQLADDMQEICLKAGYAANIHFQDRRGRIHINKKTGIKVITKEIEYKVNICRKSGTCPNFSNASIKTIPEKVKYNGKVYCVSVPNHIIYVRRNGKAVWTGNSWNSGPKPDFGIPDGAFMAHADVIHRMISGGGTFAYSSIKGFAPAKLPDYGTKSFL